MYIVEESEGSIIALDSLTDIDDIGAMSSSGCEPWRDGELVIVVANKRGQRLTRARLNSKIYVLCGVSSLIDLHHHDFSLFVFQYKVLLLLPHALMPSNKSGKNHRSKSKKKPDVGTSPKKSATSYANLIHDIEGAAGWYPVVYTICNILDIPGTCTFRKTCNVSNLTLAITDLSSRKGLKKIHENLAEISGNLDSIYVQYGDKDIVAQAVLAIYTRMCADGLLKDRLIKDSGSTVFFMDRNHGRSLPCRTASKNFCFA